MTANTEMQQPTHTTEMEALFKRMETETAFYQNSVDGLKDVRLQNALNSMLDAFAKLPLTPADKAYADQQSAATGAKAEELQERVNQLESIVSGKDMLDPLQTPEYEQALLNGDNKKAAKLETASRQLRIDRHTAAQQVETLAPALTEAKQTTRYWGRIAGAVRKSTLMQELQANQTVFNELLERLMPVWADMNRLCDAANLKPEHMYQLKETFNLPKHRVRLGPGLERTMRFELQRRPYF